MRVYKAGDPTTVIYSYTTSTGLSVLSNIISLSADNTNTQTAGTFQYVVWNTSDNVPVAAGRIVIEPEASPVDPAP